jgi:hypothetical protein
MVFELRPLINKSLFQKLFRQEPDENAIIELNNLLASQEITSIGKEDIRLIDWVKYSRVLYRLRQ